MPGHRLLYYQSTENRAKAYFKDYKGRAKSAGASKPRRP